MMYRGLNVTWIYVLDEIAYSGIVFALGFVAGRFL